MRQTMLFLLVAGLVFGAADTVAKPLTFKSAKKRFSFSYPADWNLQELDGGQIVVVASGDAAASFTVTVAEIKRGVKACEYLAERADRSETKPANLLPDDKRPISAAERRFMGVDDGCLAAYQLEVAGKEAIQGVGVYVRKGQAFIVEQKLMLADHAKFGALLSDIARSFKTY